MWISKFGQSLYDLRFLKRYTISEKKDWQHAKFDDYGYEDSDYQPQYLYTTLDGSGCNLKMVKNLLSHPSHYQFKVETVPNIFNFFLIIIWSLQMVF